MLTLVVNERSLTSVALVIYFGSDSSLHMHAQFNLRSNHTFTPQAAKGHAQHVSVAVNHVQVARLVTAETPAGHDLMAMNKGPRCSAPC